ncbi:MAG: FAD-dependent monooxygenase [Pseudomonadota bacterium]
MAQADGTGAGSLPNETTLSVDIAVVGGGPSGMVTALCAAQSGWTTALVAPALAHDPRTTALLMPAVELLDALGVWKNVEASAAPLATMRIIDATDRLPRAPEISFNSQETGRDQFGFNVPNNALNEALRARLVATDAIFHEATVAAVHPGTPFRLRTDEAVILADFVVAADGANSKVRDACGFSVRRWSYDQAAFVTTLSHQRPHGDTSTEFHTAAGPFTLVPLPGERCSLVWVGRPDEVARWAALDPGPLAREIEARAQRILGRMRVDGPRGTLPMEGLVARYFGRNNVVLVGEAGHKFPPIGAQGLNLGMRDCAVLHKLLSTARSERSLRGVADRYDKERRVDVAARTVGVDLLNRSLLTDAPPVAALRAVGVAAARNIEPLRKVMMRVGMGV